MEMILLLHPETDHVHLIKHLFNACTLYRVEFTDDLNYAKTYLRQNAVDLILIDTTFSRFAEYLLDYGSEVPILFLSPKGFRPFLEDKYFRIGHVTKPILAEPNTGYQLLISVQSVLKVYELRVSDLVLNKRRRTLLSAVTSHSVNLTAVQCSVLYELMSFPNTCIAHDTLVTRVWGEYAVWSEEQLNRSQDNLRQVIRQLRIILKEFGVMQEQIETIRGEGYLFRI